MHIENIFTKAFFSVLLFSITFTACKKDDFKGERNNLDEQNNEFAQSNPLGAEEACNGYPKLCEKTFSSIVLPVSYNSYNCSQCGGSSNAAQQISVTAQLQAGVRGLMLNVYEQDNPQFNNDEAYLSLVLKDYPTATEKWQLISVLKEIKSFMQENSNEVLVLFIDGDAPVDLLIDALEKTQLTEYLYTHTGGSQWPVLGRMVYNNERLIVFNTRKSEANKWNHFSENYILHSAKNHSTPADITCSVESGAELKTFYMMHHYLDIVVAQNEIPSNYEQVNSSSFLLERLLECTDVLESNPNFVVLKQVHFGTYEQAFKIVNGVQ
ncbi:MAG: hypothetical protein WD334_01285 [Chitinophagales bacterium]